MIIDNDNDDDNDNNNDNDNDNDNVIMIMILTAGYAAVKYLHICPIIQPTGTRYDGSRYRLPGTSYYTAVRLNTSMSFIRVILCTYQLPYMNLRVGTTRCEIISAGIFDRFRQVGLRCDLISLECN